MNIEYEALHAFKRYNLPEIIQSYGLTLKKQGTGYITNCPFHEDTNPSLSINQKGDIWLWHCFGCHKGGTVIDFIMKKENISLREAYSKLKDLSLKETSKEEPEVYQLSPKLLSDILAYYEKVFHENRKPQEYLKNRGLVSSEIYDHFRIGYSDGSLPKQKEILPSLHQSGILTEKGYELLYECVVFPIEDTSGNVLGLYGRRITNSDQRYLKGSHRGVFNAKIFKVSKRIYLTECIIDALSLYQIGIREVVSLFGAGGFTPDHIKYMKENLIEDVVLCLDNDEAGREATSKISRTLSSELDIRCHTLQLPQGIKDINDWLLNGMTAKEIEKNIKPLAKVRATFPEQTIKSYVQEVNTDINFNFNHEEPFRHYRVRGLELDRIGTFKVNLKITAATGSHLDTFDLTSSQSRERFIRMAKKLLDLNEGMVRQDLAKIIDSLEVLQSDHLAKKNHFKASKPGEITDDEKLQALELLKSPDLLERIVKDFHRCGYMGEDDNLLIGYLVASSRKLPNPLSLVVISRSAAGKTSLQDAVLEFMPEEDVVRYTRLTDQSLFYHEKNSLYKKVLAIEEEAGALGTGYALRNVLTSKCLRTGSTIKDPVTGKLINQESEVKIQTSVFLTTTRQALDYETMNRFLIASIDESEEQTQKILEYQRRLYGVEGHLLRKQRFSFTKLHRNAQRLLEPVDVINPYEKELTFTAKTLRARREQIKYLNLINVIALIKQYQKALKRHSDGSEYILVELEDIITANRLAKIYLARGLDWLSPPARDLYSLICEMVDELKGNDEEEPIIGRRQIMAHTGWTEWQIRTHMKELVDLEYVEPVQGRQGKRYAYRLMEEFEFELPRIDLDLHIPKKEVNFVTL